MALFSSANSFVGIDIGTSSLKVVELINRRRRIEVTAYAQTPYVNPLVAQTADGAVVSQTAEIISKMMESAGIASDVAVVALPASAVFSTVISLPSMPEEEMDKAVEFAARDVVPAELEDVVLGYSRLGDTPHMETDSKEEVQPTPSGGQAVTDTGAPVPVFVTAAPKYLVERYVSLVQTLKLKLLALELETFPLIRSLFSGTNPTAMIIDIGDRATTFHIVDAGTPRVSYTMEYGGHDITDELAKALSVPVAEAEKVKGATGLLSTAEARQQKIVAEAVTRQIEKAKNVLGLYERSGKKIPQTVLIGGGANLPGLSDFWGKAMGHKVTIGNPWRGLSYPDVLDAKLRYLGPTYGVAVGLALRGFSQ